MDSVTNEAVPVASLLTDVVPFKVEISEVFKTSEITDTTTLGTGLLNLSTTLTATVANVKPAVVLTGALV